MSHAASRSFRFWNPVSILFVAAVVLVPLTCRWRRQSPPGSNLSLTAQAETKLHLHVVPFAGHGDPQAGVYLCREDGRRREDLPTARQREFLREWRGIVLVMPLPASDGMIDQTLSEWGDAAAVIGDLIVWGDPALVAEIVKMVCG
jgi:hypothetical protein